MSRLSRVALVQSLGPIGLMKMAGGRHRARDTGGQSGTIQFENPPGTVVSTTVRTTGFDNRFTCDDTVGIRDVPHPLTLVKQVWQKREPLNGAITGGNVVRYTNAVANSQTLYPADLITQLPPSDALAIQTAAARSNPGRVGVHTPVFLAELRDIPHLIKQGGDLLRELNAAGRTPRAMQSYLSGLRTARRGAGIYLGYEFGVRPLISDISKMLGFTELVDKRVSELQRFYSSGGLRRRIDVFEKTDTDGGAETINSDYGGTIVANKTRVTRQKKWVVCRWRPTALPHFRNGANLRSLAKHILFAWQTGRLDTQLTEVWTGMPWTWLFDWFAHVGDFMQAHSNAIPCNLYQCTVMYNTETKVHWTRNTAINPSVTGGNATFTRSSKLRGIGALSPLPVAEIPFLNSGQYSILASLALLGRNRPGSVH